MHASRASASAKVLIVSLNWLGDCVMAMPALQSYHRQHPHHRLIMLTRAPLAPLWQMHSALTEIRVSSGALKEQWAHARRLRPENFTTAYVLPRSFRAALTPYLAGIPERYGLPGHHRDRLLTHTVAPRLTQERRHQAYEYLQLMGEDNTEAEPPAITVPQRYIETWRQRLSAYNMPGWAAIFPGAAFGPAKRWPAAHFIATARQLQELWGVGIVALGTAGERELCETITKQMGGTTLNLAGQTALPDLAALLTHCKMVIANDSGGMHLAAALQVPLVAIFGVTDPERTGPLGTRTRVLQNSMIRARDFKRHTAQAAHALAAVTPDQVIAAARHLAS